MTHSHPFLVFCFILILYFSQVNSETKLKQKLKISQTSKVLEPLDLVKVNTDVNKDADKVKASIPRKSKF